jgi:hypothetical protein
MPTWRTRSKTATNSSTLLRNTRSRHSACGDASFLAQDFLTEWARLSPDGPDAHIVCNMMFALQSACWWRHPNFDTDALWRMVTHPVGATVSCETETERKRAEKARSRV